MRRATLTFALLVSIGGGAAAQTLPCNPCAGLAASSREEATQIAASIAAGWPLPKDAVLYVLWPEALDGGTDAAAVADTARALRASGATPWLRFTLHTPPPLSTNLSALDGELRQVAALARGLERGAHVTVGWEPAATTTAAGTPAVAAAKDWAFLLKRAAVTVNGAVADARVFAGPLPGDPALLRALYAEDVAAYVDGVAFAAATTDSALATQSELDPGKPVILDAQDLPQPAGLALAEAARGAVRGAAVSFFRRADPGLAVDAETLAPFRVLAAEFHGDLSHDPSSSPAGGWTFVRGEDLNLRVIAAAPTPGDDTWTITIPDPGVRRVTRVEFSTGAEAGLRGRKVGNGVEVQVRVRPGDAVAVLRLERASAAELAGEQEVKEKVLVTSDRQMPVEEILRRLQAFEDGQRRRLRHYEAINRTSLRFLAAGAQAIDATFEGSYFVEASGRADWAWQTFYVGGVKWRAKTIPEIPLIQPEKAAAMPVDILFTSEYRYTLRGSETVSGHDCWIVDFAPVDAVEGKRLYQGTVWVDRQAYSRVKSKALQLGLTGDVLSNEETVYYSSAGEGFVLPLRVVAQQLFSFLNAVTVVEKETTLSDVRINEADFEARRAAVLASDATMVRDTEKGLRYLVKDEASGERVVKEGFDTNKLFLLGGVFYEESLDYPLPLAGLNYFDADFLRRGEQLNVFFGGVLATVNYADPSFLGSRWDAGADFFGFAIQSEDAQFRNGEENVAESVRSRPLSLALNLGRPIGNYLKLGATYRAEYRDFAATDDTAATFAVPSDHTTHTLRLDARYARSGYRLSLRGSESRRSEWRPWGFAGNPEFDPSAESYSQWGASLAKVWHLKGFRKFGAELDYFDGSDLDRFSKYEFGIFGGTRVHGYATDQVRAEQGVAGHLSYGFEIGQALRLEGVVDAARVDDEASGLDGEVLGGVGIQGTFVGPWQTVVNLDFGLAVEGPEDGFAVYLVFLKLFR